MRQVNPYEPEVDWFTRDLELHPLSSAPEPKRRFQPSKWEEKKWVHHTMHELHVPCTPFAFPLAALLHALVTSHSLP